MPGPLRLALTALLALAACADVPGRPAAPPASPSVPVAPAGSALAGAAAGALVYVPAYSHVYAGDARQQVDLAATLSIRNADARDSVRVVSVHYVGSDGRMLRSYLEGPQTLGPYATAEFVVGQSEGEGGSGAAFLVEWTAAAAVVAPVVEAVMINTAGQQGISFVTEGRVVATAGG